MITVKQAKALEIGDIIHNSDLNTDETCRRWRVSGRVKTWKRDPLRIRVPIKYGLYDNSYLETGKVNPYGSRYSNLYEFHLPKNGETHGRCSAR